MSRTLSILLLALLAVACSSVNTHGVDTRNLTVPIYSKDL